MDEEQLERDMKSYIKEGYKEQFQASFRAGLAQGRIEVLMIFALSVLVTFLFYLF